MCYTNVYIRSFHIIPSICVRIAHNVIIWIFLVFPPHFLYEVAAALMSSKYNRLSMLFVFEIRIRSLISHILVGHLLVPILSPHHFWSFCEKVVRQGRK